MTEIAVMITFEDRRLQEFSAEMQHKVRQFTSTWARLSGMILKPQAESWLTW